MRKKLIVIQMAALLSVTVSWAFVAPGDISGVYRWLRIAISGVALGLSPLVFWAIMFDIPGYSMRKRSDEHACQQPNE